MKAARSPHANSVAAQVFGYCSRRRYIIIILSELSHCALYCVRPAPSQKSHSRAGHLPSLGRRTKTLEYGSCPTQLRYHLDTLTIVAATADRAIKGVRCIRQFPLGGTGGNSRISTFQFLASHRLSLITIYYELTRRPKTQAYVMTISAHAAVYRVGFGPWVRLHPALLSTTKMTRL